MMQACEVRFLTRSQYSQLSTKFDPEYGVYWGVMNPRPRPCFNLSLLNELRLFVNSIVGAGGVIVDEGIEQQINYAVIASSTPGVFNLGGDLAMFRAAILRRDRDALTSYGRQCIECLYPWNQNCHLPLTTISLVQGEALGGGFECALASSVLIAEESARMGFPEILFNLFPGMGAYSYLVRRVGRRLTEELITSGAVYTARQLYDMGVVDVITADGTGEAAVHAYIRKHARNANGRRAVERIRAELQPVTFEELMRVVEIWVDTALKLQDRDLKMMDRLVRAQERNRAELTTEHDNVVPLAAAGGGGCD